MKIHAVEQSYNMVELEKQMEKKKKAAAWLVAWTYI